MRDHEAFSAALAAVKSLEDWIKLQRKWFDTANWPKKTSSQLAEDSARKRMPLRLGGREWIYTNSVYDISPEARYEYFYALRMVGAPFQFPTWKTSPKTADRGWRQECPYDEISTAETGDPICPKCGRKLVLTWYPD
jgi:hypothetical protein